MVGITLSRKYPFCAFFFNFQHLKSVNSVSFKKKKEEKIKIQFVGFYLLMRLVYVTNISIMMFDQLVTINDRFISLRQHLTPNNFQEDMPQIAMRWSKVLRTGSVEAKFMAVDLSTIMFTMERGQDLEEVCLFCE